MTSRSHVPTAGTTERGRSHDSTATSIEKVYRTDRIETVALADVNLDVAKGEFISIMGPSGCGKSTLLNLMGLLDAPTKGTVADQRLADRDAIATARWPRIRNKEIGFVFQMFHLVSDLSVLDNVQIPLLYRRMSNARAAEAGRGGARPRRPERAHPPLPLAALGRPAAARRHRPRDRRPAAHPARRRADRQPRLADGRRDHGASSKTLNREDKTTIVMVTHDQQKADQTERIVRLFDGRQVN